MRSIRSDVPDISQFERRLREIIYEHQRNAVNVSLKYRVVFESK